MVVVASESEREDLVDSGLWEELGFLELQLVLHRGRSRVSTAIHLMRCYNHYRKGILIEDINLIPFYQSCFNYFSGYNWNIYRSYVKIIILFILRLS